MHRAKLALASLALVTAACLTVLCVLREPPAPGPWPGSEPAAIEPARGEPVATAPPPLPERIAAAPSAGAPGDGADFVAEVARAAEAQEQALRDAILAIGQAPSFPLDARLERYQEAVQAARDQAPDAPILESRSLLAEVFLRMEAVQRELAAMSPAARSRTLVHIRRELGFDEEEVARMEEIDDRREARWQNGLAYMQERARVASSFEGDALEAELGGLREEFFAHEAPTIAAEERDGFFRFERPRIYGRN